MRSFFLTGTILLIILSAFSCKKNGIIPQDKMAEIISKMYMADRYTEQNPILNFQKDTMRLYEAIFKSYGYSKEDFFNSTKFYLTKKDSYKMIHIKAKDLLLKRVKELKEICVEIVPWWMTDTIQKLSLKELEANYKYRAVKWLAMPYHNYNWKFNDSMQVDIPAHSEWWVNNLKQDTTKFSIALKLKEAIEKEKKEKERKEKERKEKEKKDLKKKTTKKKKIKSELVTTVPDAIK